MKKKENIYKNSVQQHISSFLMISNLSEAQQIKHVYYKFFLPSKAKCDDRKSNWKWKWFRSSEHIIFFGAAAERENWAF